MSAVFSAMAMHARGILGAYRFLAHGRKAKLFNEWMG